MRDYRKTNYTVQEMIEKNMTSNLNGLMPQELEDLYLKVKKLREEVLETCEPFGFSASQLVSRNFENEIEKFYGKKLLKTKTKEIE